LKYLGNIFIPSLKEMLITMEMKMKERKIEIDVWSHSECKVGTKKKKTIDATIYPNLDWQCDC
jgi:hypothetical protein